MSNAAMFYPVFAIIILMTIIMVVMLRSRVQGVKKGEVDYRFFRTYNSQEYKVSDEVVKIGRNFSNLFEVPLVFFVVCLFYVNFSKVDIFSVGLAWLFVGFRYWHSWVHIGSNRVMWRLRAYGGAVVVNLILWVYLFYKLSF